MNNKTILVVDDNPVILRCLSSKLKASGYAPLTANDGASAVSAARQRKPNLILLDLNFPPDVAHGGGVPWDGLLIMSWLKRLDEASKIPVIVISGGEPLKNKERAMAAGAVNFFHKPINSEDLMTAIDQALSKSPTPGVHVN